MFVAVITIGHCAVNLPLSFSSEPLVIPAALRQYKIMIYRTIIFAPVLLWCEYRPVPLGEERSLWVLRRIFGVNVDGMTGERRRLHAEDRQDV
jgi:hypothetical protein